MYEEKMKVYLAAPHDTEFYIMATANSQSKAIEEVESVYKKLQAATNFMIVRMNLRVDK